MRRKGPRKAAKAAAGRFSRTGRARRSRGGRIAAIEKTAVRPQSAGAAARARTAGSLRRRRRGHRRAIRRAVLPGHQRIGGTANRQRAHHEQSDVAGTLHGLGGRRDDRRCTLAELPGWRSIHLGQRFHEIIEAALSAPAASEESPSQIAGATSPAAIFADRLGIGILTTKYTTTWTISATRLQIRQSTTLAEWAIAL